MLEDNIVVATKQTIAVTLDSKHYGENKGKMGRDDQDKRGKRDSRDLRRTNEAGGSGDRVAENPR